MHRIIFRKSRTAVAHIVEQTVPADIVRDLFHTSDEFRPEYKHVYFGKFHTILDLFCGISEIKRYCKGSCLKYSEIDRQPFQAVHQKDRDFVSFFDPAFQKQIRKSV